LASAGAATLGGVFWLGGAFAFIKFFDAWTELHGREIAWLWWPGIRTNFNVYGFLNAHWAAVCVLWGLVVACLAVTAAWTNTRLAWKAAGLFAATCFLSWYGLLPFLILDVLMSLISPPLGIVREL
jgi:hypothetical protein